MNTLRIALAAALLMTAGAATAQSAGDAQCIILSNAFANEAKDAKQQEAAQAAMYFYLGRIGDQMTAAQLKTLFDAQMKSIDNKTAGAAMNKCVAAVETKVQLMESLSPKPAPATPEKK